MEVQRSKIRELGVNWLFLNQSSYIYSTPGTLVPITGIMAPFGGPPALTASQNLISGTSLGFGLMDSSNIFQAFIEALKKEALLKILAEPELVTTSGRPANLLSGVNSRFSCHKVWELLRLNGVSLVSEWKPSDCSREWSFTVGSAA